MKKLILYVVLVAGLILSTSACKSSDNLTDPVTPISEINGNWRTASWTSNSGGIYDSLVVELKLTETDGVVSGTGTVAVLFQDSGKSISATFNGNVKGSYSGQNINITLTSSITGDKYIYTGSWKSRNINFSGTASIKVLGVSHIYQEVSLFKK